MLSRLPLRRGISTTSAAFGQKLAVRDALNMAMDEAIGQDDKVRKIRVKFGLR